MASLGHNEGKLMSTDLKCVRAVGGSRTEGRKIQRQVTPSNLMLHATYIHIHLCCSLLMLVTMKIPRYSEVV